MLREQGVRGAVTFSLPENRSIRRAWKKMGWRPFGVAGFLRIGPIRLEFVRVRGHTRWRLRRRRPASARSQPPPAEPDLLDESAREVADRRTAAA